MAKWKKLAHVVYQCSYHIVWCPKYRFRILKGGIAEFISETIRSLCEWKAIEILVLSVREDHVHAVVSIPPKLSISEVVGTLKGKKNSNKGFQELSGVEEQAVLGQSFLEPRVLCHHCRDGRKQD